MWRQLKGYEGIYEISINGKVRRVDGHGSDGRTISSHPISTLTAVNGKKYISLWKNGKRMSHMLHNVYAETFGVSIPEACRRLYGGFQGSKEAQEHVCAMLQELLSKCISNEETQGKNLHDEKQYLISFLEEMIGDVAGLKKYEH